MCPAKHLVISKIRMLIKEIWLISFILFYLKKKKTAQKRKHYICFTIAPVKVRNINANVFSDFPKAIS